MLGTVTPPSASCESSENVNFERSQGEGILAPRLAACNSGSHTPAIMDYLEWLPIYIHDLCLEKSRCVLVVHV